MHLYTCSVRLINTLNLLRIQTTIWTFRIEFLRCVFLTKNVATMLPNHRQNGFDITGWCGSIQCKNERILIFNREKFFNQYTVRISSWEYMATCCESFSGTHCIIPQFQFTYPHNSAIIIFHLRNLATL